MNNKMDGGSISELIPGAYKCSLSKFKQPRNYFDALPEKSRKLYEKCYEEFKEWLYVQDVKAISESVLLSYFNEKSKSVRIGTLKSVYSMLKCMLNIRDGIKIQQFYSLKYFLKEKSVGYQAKTSRVLTPDQINCFLLEASDHQFLLHKVVLIMGISGSLRCDDLLNMTVDDIQEEQNVLIITAPHSRHEKRRVFTITNPEFIRIYRKYIALRPKHMKNRRFFVRYNNGNCMAQVVGTHKIGKIPSIIAEFLNLENSEEYTGHCFRRSSSTLLANASIDMLIKDGN